MSEIVSEIEGSVVTMAGHALIAKLLAARMKLKITRASVGDGDIPAGTAPENLTALVHETKAAEIAGVSNPVGGEAMISLQISSVGADMGFYVKELGIFAEDPDAGEILYSYTGIQNHPQWIRPEGTAIGNFAIFDICIVVDRMEHIEAVISLSAMASVVETDRLQREKADKVKNAVAGNIAVLGHDGDIGDYGEAPANLLIDGGYFENTLSVHAQNRYAHDNLNLDGNAVIGKDAEDTPLNAHNTDPGAHQNIILSGTEF